MADVVSYILPLGALAFGLSAICLAKFSRLGLQRHIVAKDLAVVDVTIQKTAAATADTSLREALEALSRALDEGKSNVRIERERADH